MKNGDQSMYYGREDIAKVDAPRIGFDHCKFAQSNFVKLDANEIEFSCDEIRRIAADAVFNCDLSRYPDPDSTEIKRLISKEIGFPLEKIVVGNGSDEILNNIFLSFHGMKAMVPDISYPVYYHLAVLNDIKLQKIILDDQYDLPCDLDIKISEFEPDVVFFSYPNNPTGTMFRRDLIENLIATFPKTVFVIDEAYFEFSGQTFLNALTSCNNVLVIRTFSKVFALAGLRIGYAVATDPLVGMLKKTKLIYSVSTVTQAIAKALIPIMRRNIRNIVSQTVAEREKYSKLLSRVFKTVPAESAANFVFLPIPSFIDLKSLERSLIDRQVFFALHGLRKKGCVSKVLNR
jgi:histidinol-phosphate aminotransferase